RTTGIFEGYSLVMNNKFEFGLGSAGGIQDIAISTITAVPGTWYHVVGTFQQPNSRIYVNGTLEGSATHNFPLDYGPRPLFIGRSGEDGTNGALPFDSAMNG